MPALPPSVLEPLWLQFTALLPAHQPSDQRVGESEESEAQEGRRDEGDDELPGGDPAEEDEFHCPAHTNHRSARFIVTR